MRSVFSFPPLTPFVKKLILTLLGSFVAELVLQNFVGIDVVHLLGLDPVRLGPLTALQLLSYVLVENPQAVMSMLIGLLFMWLILSPFEATFGSRRAIELSVAGTLGAGLFAIGAAQLTPYDGYVFLGSHPIAYAGMAAMARVMQRGRIMFFGVVPMTSKQLLLVLVGLSALEFLASKDHIMFAGSVGAIAAGVGYVMYMARTPKPPRKKSGGAPRFRVVRGGGSGGGGADSPGDSDSDGDGDHPKWLN